MKHIIITLKGFHHSFQQSAIKHQCWCMIWHYLLLRQLSTQIIIYIKPPIQVKFQKNIQELNKLRSLKVFNIQKMYSRKHSYKIINKKFHNNFFQIQNFCMFASSLLVEKLNNAFRLCGISNTESIKHGEKILCELRNNAEYPFIVIAYMTDQYNLKQNKLRASVQLRIWVEQHTQQNTNDLLNTLLPAYFICEQFLVKQMRLIMVNLPCDQGIMKKIYSYDNGSYLNKIRSLKLIRKILKLGQFEWSEDPNFYSNLVNGITQQLQLQQQYELPFEIQYELLKLLLQIKDYDLCRIEGGDPEIFNNNVCKWLKITKKIININTKDIKNPVFVKLKIKSFQFLVQLIIEIQTFSKQIENFVNQVLCIYKSQIQLRKYCIQFFFQLIFKPNGRNFLDQYNHKNQLLYKIAGIVIENLYNSEQIIDSTKNYQDFIEFFYQNNDRETSRGIARLILKQLMNSYTDLWLDIINTGIENPFKGNQNNSLLTFLCESYSKYDNRYGIISHMIPHSSIQKVYNSIVRQNFKILYEKVSNQKVIGLCEDQILQFLCDLRFVIYFRNQIQSNQLLLSAKLCSKMAIKYPILSTICYFCIKNLITIKEQIKGPYYFKHKNQFRNFFSQILQDFAIHSFHLTLADLEVVSYGLEVCSPNQQEIFVNDKYFLKKIVQIVLQLSSTGQKYQTLEHVLKIGQLYVKYIGFQPEFQVWILKLIKAKIINRSVLQMYGLYLTRNDSDYKTIESIYQQMSDPQYWIKNKENLDFSISFYVAIISKYFKGFQSLNIVQQLFNILPSIIMDGNNNNIKDFEPILTQILVAIHHLLKNQHYDKLYQLILSKITNKNSKFWVKSLLRITEYHTSNRFQIKHKIIQLIVRYKHLIKTLDDVNQCINLIFQLFQNYFTYNNKINWQSWAKILCIIIKNFEKPNFRNCTKKFVDNFNQFNNYYHPNISELINQKMQIALTKIILNEKNQGLQK